MAVHSKQEIFPALDEEVSGGSFLEHPLPKYRFPLEETEPAPAYQLVHDQLLLDGNSRQNLATFCQTWVEPEVRQLMDECLDKNLIDRDEYPQTTELESRCVYMLADLWHCPDAANTQGCSTTGSSEAAMLGGLAMKYRWKKRRQQEHRPTHRPNLICGPVHTCWPRFARYFDVELRQVPCVGNRLLMSPEEVLKRCDENTIGVVPTLGVTYTLQYEPVHAIALALDDFEEVHGIDIPIHIDAASGGFTAPFLHPAVSWDFRLPRVRSINVSGHKFGLSPLGCGWIVWRTKRDLPEDLVFDVKYLGGHMRSFALNFSRPGGQVVAQYYNFIRLGRKGYTRIAKSCQAVGSWFADELRKFEIFELIYDGRDGLPGCTWSIKPGEYPRFDLYDLADRLRGKGWQVPAYPMPPHRTDLVVQRMVSRLGVSRDLAGLLMDDLRQAVRFLSSSRARPSVGVEAASGYHHI
ncbi:glutamate decarboxylase [Silvibacterium acidisoli]|uniref:glutamate decarboxylase n=1 Tax=Acidobacteriaceae bacterium ZG23-2 TaxID=2883246 RepID=UPI00406D3043